MNSDEFNKIAGAVIGSLLLFLLLGFFSGKIYDSGHGGGHDDRVLAYALEVEETEAQGDEAETIDLAALVASADIAAGQKGFSKCKACHKVEEGVDGVGPNLWGVVGRKIASVDGYAYSGALAELDGDWDFEALSGFLENPKGYASGTKMAFAGIKKPQDRVNLIAYLNDADGSPIELASAPAAEEVATDATEDAAQETEETTVEEVVEDAATAVAETADEAVAAVSEAPATGGAGLAALAATASVKLGKKVFRKCRACHSPDEGKNGVGPSLYGVVGRAQASTEGYDKYSDALLGLGGTWTPAELMAYLEDPKAYAPGNRMNFPGVKDEVDRMGVILFLNETDGSPEPIE